MEMPSVRSTIKDPAKDVTYHVMAYRTLSREELVQSVRAYHSSRRTKKLKKGQVITIMTIIGAN